MDELDATPTGAENSDDDSDLISALSGDSEPSDSHDSDDYDLDNDEPKPQPETYTVKINGSEKSVTHDELIAHYQKGEAANQKFEEAAALRRENEQYRASVAQHQEQLQQAINHFMSQAQQWAAQGEPNWQDLLENNPQEYLRQQHIYRERAAAIQQAQAAQAHLNQQRQADSDRQMQEYLRTEAPKILEFIPEWKDPEKRATESQEMYAYLASQGYTPEDIHGFNHSKAKNFELVVKAMRYDKLIAKTRGGKQTNVTPIKPVPTVGGNNSAPSKKSPEKMSDDEFAKWRKQHIARRR